MNTSNAGLWDSLRTEGLQWLPERGFGWFPVTASPYDASYWENYRRLDRTPVGEALTRLRCRAVAKTGSLDIVDVGIGGGRFVEESSARGFDVNPAAVAWLQQTGRWADPYRNRVDTLTFWDSLEHIHDPRPLLANVDRFVVASLPIFRDCADVLRSKHFKKDEHCWYFTATGFVGFMGDQGFELLDHNDMEQAVGREQIETFTFKRRADA